METKKIVVIEDDDSIQKVLRARLEKSGYQVAVASTGGDGLKAVRETRPHVIILDVMLPDANGFDVCQQIKEMDELFKVIIYTGKLEAVDARRARQVGADDFTVKTMDFKYLLESIAKLTA
ncbi:MAG TPA: response regulator [Candidatus Omnitrophota bacterium]|nr:response regulator [Candidatus Omnitrophota bacterium]HQL42015.1 response regulator [Candidatus Omnitrophota bacterium]